MEDGGIYQLVSSVQIVAVSTSSSFTALLEFPPSQSVQLIHSQLLPSNSSGGFPAIKCESLHAYSPLLAANLSAPLISDPTMEDTDAPPSRRQSKRRDCEKKGYNNNNGSKKRSKSGAGKESSEETEKLP